ncbi:unnamed protein product [Heterosigma akashiwo]
MKGFTFFVVVLVALLHSAASFQSGFVGKAHARLPQISSRAGPMMVIPALAKKAKENAVNLRKQSIESDADHPVMKKMALLQGDGPLKPSTLVKDNLTRPKGSLTVVAEYRRKFSKAGWISEILPPYFLSRIFRISGAKAAAVYIDENLGGATLDDIREFVKEQAENKGEYPSPIPVVARDLIVDEFQLAEVAEAGAAGVTLSLSVVGAERAAQLRAAAAKLGLEAIAQVTSAEEAEQARELGFAMVAVAAGYEALREMYPRIPEDLLKIAFLERNTDEGMEEIEEAWQLRRQGYNGVWVSELIYKGGMDEHENTKAIIKALLAKTSTTFGRAKAISGKGEGAKEYLGTILM